MVCKFAFTNQLLEEQHLHNTYCNEVLDLIAETNNEIVIHSKILEDYIKNNYSNIPLTSSITKGFDLETFKKAIQEAKKNLVEVPIVGTTIPHEYIGEFGSAKVMLKPAKVGTGLITGGSVRPVLELAGYRDVRTKVIGTNNPRNVVYATIEGLKNMRTIEQVAKKRNKKVDEIM